MRPLLIFFVLTSFVFCHQPKGTARTFLSDDISLVFPDTSVKLQEGGFPPKIFTLFKDSFQIIATVATFDHEVSADSVNQINGIDANVVMFSKPLQGENIFAERQKLENVDVIHFEFESPKMMHISSGLKSLHKGMVIYYKNTLSVIDFISDFEVEQNIQKIRDDFFYSLDIK